MTRLTMIFAATALLVFTTTGCADTAKWRVTPSMRLPAPPEVKAKVVKVLAYHDFADDTDTWRPRSEHITVERVADGHDSSGALRVTGTQPDGWNFAWSPMISVEANRTYRASLWIKRNSTPEGSGPLFFKAEIFNRERKKKAARAMSARIPLNDVGNWHRLSVEFTPVEGAQHVGIALEKGTGEPAAIDATIDDFRLEQLEASTVDLRMRSAQLVGPIAKELVGVHPRLYMDAAKLEQLRTEVRTNPKWAPAMKALLEIADRGVLRGVPDYDKEVATPRKTESKAVAQLWERPIGNMMPHLAMAWLLTGDRKYLDSAKQWVLTALDYPTWGMGTQNNMNLAAGHLFAGVGLAYDWLYHDLTQEERAAIRRKLVPRGMEMLRGAETGRAPWRNAYMQNHLWVSVGGLATSAFAICDEAPEANAWVHLAHDNFVKTLETVGDDGASHEGYGYWEYGAEYIMRYTELADSMLGIDLYHADGAPHP